MNQKTLAKVTFYRLKDNAAKIQLICTKAKESFQIEKRLLITVPSFEAAQYVESLLWRFPEESFMPHVIADTTTKEWIAITMQDKDNINQAPRLLNLCPLLSPLSNHVEEVYELYDETHPQKKELSEQRMRHYQALGFLVKFA
jgi:DNA polymerase-3 subunit chi